MNNARRLRAARPRVRNPVVLGTDGIGADMLEEFRLAYVRHREDDVRASPETAWAWLENGWRARARGARRPGDAGRYDHDGARGTSRSRPACGRSTSRSTARSCSTRRRRDPGRRRPRSGPRPPSRPQRLFATAVSDRPHDRAPVALYLQDAHPIREAWATRSYAEARGLRGRVAGREPPRARGDGADGRVRRGHRAHQGRLRRRRHAGPATPRCLAADVLDARRPRARAGCILGIGAWWDPLAAQGRHRPRPSRCTAMREIVTVVRALLATRRSRSTASSCTSTASSSTTCTRSAGRRTCPIYIGATGMQMMELTGEIADGVRAQLPRVARVQRARRSSTSPTARPRPGATLDDIDRPQLVVCSLDEDRDARARRRPAARHPVPRPAAAHHEGVGRARVAARRDRQGAHVAGHPRAGRRRVEARARRRSCR